MLKPVLGVVCGLASEAALAQNIPGPVLIACAGSRPQQARWQARQLVKDGATRLISFGIAGALEPGLPVGSLIIGTQALSVDGMLACDSAWIDRLAQQLPTAHCGPVWGSETLISTARAKRMLYERSRCLIVDMESHCVAQIAQESGLPFAILRAVSDGAETELPTIVNQAIRPDGHIDGWRITRNMLRHPLQLPSQIPDLIRLGKGTNKALAALKQCVMAVG